MKVRGAILWLIATLLLTPLAANAVNDPSEQQVRAELNNYLWDAARNGSTEQIKILIDEKYDLNVADDRGYTAVILAAYNGHDETLKMLLDAGADACQRDKKGNSALMGAVFKGEIKIARRLIAAECSPDLRNNAGQTAAMYASLFQRKELLQALKEKGADIQATDINGNSVLTLEQGQINGVK